MFKHNYNPCLFDNNFNVEANIRTRIINKFIYDSQSPYIINGILYYI